MGGNRQGAVMRYGTGVALALTAAVLWSLQGLLFRQIDTAGVWAVLFWRSAGMVPVLAGFVLWRQGRLGAALRAVGWPGVVGGLGLVAAFGGAIYALQATTVAMAVFLYSAAPFLAAILGWLVLGEKVRPATWAAIALAACGIVIMVREGLALGALAGNLAALVSALGFAVFSIALRWGRLADMMPAVIWGGLFAMIFALAMTAATPGATLAAPPSDIAWAMGMGAGTLAGGMVLYTLASRVMPAAELTLITLVEVLLSPVWVWWLMGETAGAGTLLGGAILMGAVAVNAGAGLRRSRARAPAA